MKPQRKKTRSKRYLFKIVLVLMVLAYALFHYANQRTLLRDLTAQKEANDERILSLQTEIETLEKEIAYSESLEFVEKVARDDLGMVRPREIIYIDVGEEDKDKEEEEGAEGWLEENHNE